MPWDNEKDTSANMENVRLLREGEMDLRLHSPRNTKVQPGYVCAKHQPPIYQDVLPSSKLIYEDVPTDEGQTSRPDGDSSGHSVTTITLPSIVVNDGNENDDDPPPYTAITPPNHVGWPFDFSPGNPYSVHTAPPCRAEVPLAPFQTPLTSGSSFHPEGTNGQHTSIPMPLMPYRILKFGSHRSLFVQSGTPLADNTSITKDVSGRTRRYGVILVAAAVIVFLMVLSLMVRFVVQRSFWRG